MEEEGDIEVGYWADPYGSYNLWYGYVDEVNVVKEPHPSVEHGAKKHKYVLKGKTVVSLE